MKRLFLVLVLLLAGCASSPEPVKAPRLALPPADRVAAALPHVRAAAAKHDVAEDLILGVIRVESSFRPEAGSRVGARGLMQLMPRTAASLARKLGYDDFEITDPAFNVDAGTSYLKYLLRRYDGKVDLALAAYNSGPGRVSGWLRDGRALPAYSRRYVAAVLQARQQMQRYLAGDAPAEGQDRAGLRALIRDRSALYGERPDEPL